MKRRSSAASARTKPDLFSQKPDRPQAGRFSVFELRAALGGETVFFQFRPWLIDDVGALALRRLDELVEMAAIEVGHPLLHTRIETHRVPRVGADADNITLLRAGLAQHRLRDPGVVDTSGIIKLLRQRIEDFAFVVG